ncbi:MAG: zinc-dependent metalloprotease [Longimicrobiales bacterium]
MRRSLHAVAFLALAAALSLAPTPRPAVAQARAQTPEPLPTIAEKIRGMEKRDGFIPLYWDARTGKIWLEIGRFGEEILYYPSLPAGMGQNDIGLNRGDLGPESVVTFQRVGPRILMVEPNYGYRAVSEDPLERKSVEDGFPTSVLWGFEVAAETGDAVLVDATDFFLRDAHGVITTLRRSNQGSYRLETSRSAIYLPRTRAFPKNTEVEVTLTFTTDQPGALVRSVTPKGEALTVRQHHSFVELPTEPFEMRKADPRAGFNGIGFMDYATPLGEPLQKQYIARHRLEKKNPAAAMSEPVEPIVYYLDPGTPEPIRSALLEGASWWNEAFEAAGFIDGFQVKMLPADADPMDARYNMIQWVHRSTRGWSYGNSLVDPRTGEILKGHVTLGSLRVRQDWLLGEGLTSPYLEGDEIPEAVTEMALARIRQLGCHEVGHTIGLSHNYISSAQTGAAKYSVMDYPHPIVELDGNGNVELRDAYPRGIGDWDKFWIRYGYTDFAPGTDEDAALDAILDEAHARGLTFISDEAARPAGSAHPNVHLWDNGANAAEELRRMMEVRRVALDRFGETAIKTGMPMATLEEVLVPLYLHHRYQAEATTKVVAGLYYTYALRGDGQEPLRFVPVEEQWAALDALRRTLNPEELTIPRSILQLIPPRPFRYPAHQELFQRNTGLVFDAIAPATAAADMTLSFLLHPERAARMVQQKAIQSDLPGLDDVLGHLVENAFGMRYGDGYESEVSRAVQRVLVDRMVMLAGEAPMAQVRAEAARALELLDGRIAEGAGNADEATTAHYALLRKDIRRFLDRPHESLATPSAPVSPPGSPIGDPGMDWLDRWWFHGPSGGGWMKVGEGWE